MSEEKHTKAEEKAKERKRSNASSFTLGIIVFLAILLVGLGLYGMSGVKKGSESDFVLGVAGALNVTAAKVNGTKIPYTEYIRDKQIVRSFNQSEAAEGREELLSEEQISDQVMARLIASAIVEQVAPEYGVEVTSEELDATMERILSQAPDRDEAEKQLMERFGWSIDEYKQNVLIHLEREYQLRLAYLATSGEAAEHVQARHILFQVTPGATDEDRVETRELAESVLQEIREGGDFAAFAAEHNTDSTKNTGGDLGWFPRGAMVPAFEEAVFSLEAGQLYDSLVETQYGFHIVETTGREERAAQRTDLDFDLFMDRTLREADIEILHNIRHPFLALWEQQDALRAAQNGGEVMEDISAQ